jgi:polar amino acid transport system substrate-binding protein
MLVKTSFNRLSAIFLSVSLISGAMLTSTATNAWSETLMEKIKKTGKVTVGTEAQLPPFEFIKDGKIVGYGKDILDYIVKDLKVQLVQLDLPWQGILPGVLAGKFDFVATSVGMREERVSKYAFTMPIAYGQDVALKRVADKSIKTVDDLKGKVAGTQLASSSEASAKGFDAKMKAAGGGFKEIKLYTSHPETYLALANGELDVVISGRELVSRLMRERPGLFEIVGPVADKVYTAWVTRPEDKDFRDYLNVKIKEMRDSGLLYELQKKWFESVMEVPDSGYLPPGAI